MCIFASWTRVGCFVCCFGAEVRGAILWLTWTCPAPLASKRGTAWLTRSLPRETSTLERCPSIRSYTPTKARFLLFHTDTIHFCNWTVSCENTTSFASLFNYNFRSILSSSMAEALLFHRAGCVFDGRCPQSNGEREASASLPGASQISAGVGRLAVREPIADEAGVEWQGDLCASSKRTGGKGSRV